MNITLHDSWCICVRISEVYSPSSGIVWGLAYVQHFSKGVISTSTPIMYEMYVWMYEISGWPEFSSALSIIRVYNFSQIVQCVY